MSATEQAKEISKISPSEHRHLQTVYAEADNAQRLLNEAAARLNQAIGARQSFMKFLAIEYHLVGDDAIDVETGSIERTGE